MVVIPARSVRPPGPPPKRYPAEVPLLTPQSPVVVGHSPILALPRTCRGTFRDARGERRSPLVGYRVHSRDTPHVHLIAQFGNPFQIAWNVLGALLTLYAVVGVAGIPASSF